jgi:hypothetical protein
MRSRIDGLVEEALVGIPTPRLAGAEIQTEARVLAAGHEPLRSLAVAFEWNWLLA